ncbi:unnamed protein product [Phyllotreta striolata]|uniref:Dynein beta chain, ciliary n=1 Tax=Phyllotreta striolata TaxID=444603 RepID=A0A9N9TRJ1_PHYSR|nr:unnamed protein product [Phyllotreta striolata]
MDENDERLEFILTYLTKSIKLKQDKWNKLLLTEDYMKIVRNFLLNPEEPMLIFTLILGGALVPFTQITADIKQKFTYFVRVKEQPINVAADFANVVVFGDMAARPVEEMAVLLEGVFVPVLSNPGNQLGWPKVVANDVVTHVRNFKATVDQIKGAMKSITILPIPPGASRVFMAVQNFQISRGEEVDFQLKISIENFVMKWASTITEILGQSSNIIFVFTKYPIPQNELDYWTGRNKNLESIYDQLRDPRVRKMGEFLELCTSSYTSTFKTLLKKVVSALVEARDITMHLQVYLNFSQFFEGDFFEMEKYIKPLLHVIALLWVSSKYYSTNERIVNLIKITTNSLLASAEIALDPGNMFGGDADQVHLVIGKCIKILNRYMDWFEYVRNNLESYYKEEGQVRKPWTFHRRQVFQRVLDFIDRLMVIDRVVSIQIDYSKLDKVELGGLRCKTFSTRVVEIAEEFMILYMPFASISYDILDLDDMRIVNECSAFEEKVVDMDRRLLSILCNSIEDCCNLESLFKFICVAGVISKRTLIYEALKPKIDIVITLFNEELVVVKTIFDDAKKNGIPIDKHFPPTAGKLFYLKKLRGRIAIPYKMLKDCEDDIHQCEDAQYIYVKCEQWFKLLDKEQDAIMKAWVKTIPAQVTKGMSKFQLLRDSEKLTLSLNFDDELRAILREVRYMKQIKITGIPEEALAIFDKIEIINDALFKFFRIIEWYNFLRTSTTPTELDLITKELVEVDLLLNFVINVNTWYTHDADLVNNIYEAIKSLIDRVKLAQENVKRLMSNVKEWSEFPLFERKDGKKEMLLSLDDLHERVNRRYNKIEASSRMLDEVIQENYILFFKIVPEEEEFEEGEEFEGGEGGEGEGEGEDEEGEGIDEEEEGEEGEMMERRKPVPKPPPPPPEPEPEVADKKKKKKKGKEGKGKGKDKDKKKKKKVKKTDSEIAREQEETARLEEEAKKADLDRVLWLAYLKEIDELLEDQIVGCVNRSVSYFTQETGDAEPVTPLLELIMELHDVHIIFQPSVNVEDTDNFMVRLEGLVERIYEMALYLKRADPEQEEENFFRLVNDKIEIQTKVDDFMDRVISGMKGAEEFIKEFEEYIVLWTTDRAKYLAQFLLYGRQLTPQEEEALQDETRPHVKETPPILEQFQEKIAYYDELYKKVEATPEEKIINGWLKLDVRPLRQIVLNYVCKWGFLFKNHLYNKVINNLDELDNFITDNIKKMQTPLTEEDYDALLMVMQCLFAIRDRTIQTDAMFEPIRIIMETLATYGMTFPEEVVLQFMEMPDRWAHCKKFAAATKQLIAPLQAIQMISIKRRLQIFDIRQAVFREYFKKLPFFLFTFQTPYDLLDKVNRQVVFLEEEVALLKEQSDLFELQFPDYKGLRKCRREIRLIKQTWDCAIIVTSSIDEWRDTPWKKLDVESMEMECKKFAKEIRIMDRRVKAWNLFIQLEATVRNMLTSLRAVTELQNPAIRERHWLQLMQTTKVRFVMTDDTTLADLLSLNLHRYEEEVKAIVDKAVKEMAMEKVIKELYNVWTVLEFLTDTHERTKLKLLMLSEETVEMLEEHQVALQNMMSSKYIDFFITEVTEWQTKLSMTDQVLNVYLEVQRKWMYLESIFIGSEDIRNQLPEDSKRFERIDREFKEILRDMSANLNIVRATNKFGLSEKLEELLKDLILCEKALNDYLDMKRLAFPRFYFVSSADLLDILSNGNSPELIQRHLIKLFDSLAKLKFTIEQGKATKKARAMQSKEEEIVPFAHICDCSGKVEMWLGRVIDIMRLTLHDSFYAAVISYDEKPRELWINDYPAQPALCGTQIWWTTEVNMTFAKLEEGYENALKDYQRKQINQLNALIVLLLGDLTELERQKIMTICTIDVHARDVVAKMIVLKVDSSAAFQWQSQLRHRWDDKKDDCYANICDAEFRYTYEYLGNTPRLVITPLTDRCYITLTQSLHLVMGGAPAGPAGTGKTETTKDLGKALGMMVYVFNCSEQMDYRSMGSIYKGLAQTGCWGCFDEFNRISVEVLSVVAVQVKTLQDAIKNHKSMFDFSGEYIKMIPTVGLFITMNPGYAGRTELPENLKSLFRPCAMVVPDFALICEIMLVAEGFMEARLLARKFITLYTLCKELLSKQDHYDWGLRAIKSVLVVAGSLKRSDRQRPEDQVLMRALRDFNIPKIVTDDVAVFMGLIGDLFPALDVPRKRNLDFEKMCKKTAVDLKLQPEESFILKVVQLEELLAVRHSVFIIGNEGTGKTMVWKTLHKTYANLKMKPMYNDLNPKAVTNDELFGIINPATREWKDGLVSVILRDQANLPGPGPKWIIFDGDIDPMWIETMNTVMDDNKVLTLASNERIALTKGMRLLFEIANLRTATPATVSRAGILYVNPADVGWNPYVTSWIDTRPNPNEKAILTILFDKYIPPVLEMIRSKFKKITPICDVAHLSMLVVLLDCFLTHENVPAECPKEWYEIYFAFSIVWAFGSALFQDQITDWRSEFSKWFLNEFKSVKFPAGGNVFNYYIHPESKKFLPWTDLIKEFELDADIPLQATLVNTSETTRIRFFLDNLMAKRTPVMLVGPAGSGKTVCVQEKLDNMSEEYAVTNVPFNFYTTSELLQNVLELPLEKKAGRVYAPPANKIMVYFVDDMNMPEVDKYFTVQPHTLLRQYMDYQHWYDRVRFSLKDIHNIQFVSCMNPTAGSFTIDPRLQRHFCVFSVGFPSEEACLHIYNSIYGQHVANPTKKFIPGLEKTAGDVVYGSLLLHLKTSAMFLPTAIRFHYIFTLRDLSNIFQGMLFANGDATKTPSDMIRLWLHESSRVYKDKLIDRKDQTNWFKMAEELIKKTFESADENIVFAEPLIFTHFSEGIGDPKYMPIHDFNQLSRILNEALSAYNDLVGTMNLVLFEDAMYHICRINRIMESPRGNALLVGVGGSGKQSLTRLAAFISSFEVFQIQLKRGYSMTDMKADIAAIYLKVGLKSVGVTFLMTDAQVPEESYLVIINDVLASGEVNGLLPDDVVENIINTVKGEVKGLGMQDTKENCWKFFIDRVRRLLKVVLSFSPVGSTLRVRARKFPALVNSTSIDWFQEWPQEALRSVSFRFLNEIEVLPKPLVERVSIFMSYVHGVVNDMSQQYYLNEKRYNYTTPKSFLEQIDLYKKLLTEKTLGLVDNIYRLENGITKLISTGEEVDGLKEVLAVQEVELTAKNEAAGKLIAVVSAENEKVGAEQAFASEEEAKVRVIEEDVSAKAKLCEEDLARAEPALIAAQEALNTLNKNNLTELKSFGSPPAIVREVCAAVLVLFSKKGKIPKERGWKECKQMMNKVDEFLNNLLYYDKDNMSSDVVKVVMEYTKNPEFEPDKVATKSLAAAGLASWVINILKYYDVFQIVGPKRRALAQAQKDLNAARQKLAELNEKLGLLEEQLDLLRAEYDDAINEKLKCQAEADATNMKIDIANRLVGGLASEKVRWGQLIESYKENIVNLPGDILLITAFISYVGCFTKNYRTDMLNKYWLPFMTNLDDPIPKTEDLDPLTLLTDDAQIAMWNNEGLPTDRMSAENACILTNSARWPLMIDPQFQGIKWIKSKYGDALTSVRPTARGYIEKMEKCISKGEICLLENIGESVESVLDNILGRVLIKRGTVVKIGDKEVDWDPKFRLILHTKLANPHYKPEIQAQATLINFTVTRDGLEEQLLSEVVKAERPDLDTLKSELTKQQNDFKIILKSCEDNLLYRLSSATGNILEDVELVTNLETTKKTATEIGIKMEEAKITSVKIDEARESYRPCATRASLLYFILSDLIRINAIYQFSLKAFRVVFVKALMMAEPTETLEERVVSLLDSITFSVFMYTSRGLFERDKLTYTAQMVFQILLYAGEIDPKELDFLLRFPAQSGLVSPVDFLSNIAWGGIKALTDITEFAKLDKDIVGSMKRWQKFVDSEAPEKEKFPGEWKGKNLMQKLCIMRCLRPDRMTYAVTTFIEQYVGNKYVSARGIEFAKSYEETSATTPVFFILSAGVDPLKDVEALGKKLGFTFDNKNLHSISLGQGQEIVAENAMDVAARYGHWVILQNIHLVTKWLPSLEKKMEVCFETGAEAYRLFLSAEPSGDPTVCVIPQGILEASIKITNEPPTGMFANLHSALYNFNQETLEMCSKESEFKAILFALCYFHAVVAERRKFGPPGWNRNYPFNIGDLTISVAVLFNYLENNAKVPWENLRYIFGEIMYGGHITDDWDRRLCRSYLMVFMQPELLDGEVFYCEGFPCPPNLDYAGYHKYIDERLPTESPYLYGLHPNAEIGFLATMAESMFRTIFEMQPRDAGGGGGIGISREDKIKYTLEDIQDRLPDRFPVQELMAKCQDKNPYIIVAFQECDRMNSLTSEMKRSLHELELGLKGELTITPSMEELEEALFLDQVPVSWSAKAYPSLLPLGQWASDLVLRIQELSLWLNEFTMPPTVWLGGFFNPQSFLTAIMQQTSRKNEWPLDRMCLTTDVTKKMKDEFTAPPREGAYVSGLFMEGARWDTNLNSICDSRLKDLFPVVPVIFIKAITQDKQDLRNMYDCPVYKTRMRGPTFVWTFNLRTRENPLKWVLAGVAILLQI